MDEKGIKCYAKYAAALIDKKLKVWRSGQWLVSWTSKSQGDKKRPADAAKKSKSKSKSETYWHLIALKAF